MRSLILGTAGHIDHGKTALVRALTGVDTDRLAEEKERGITIDLGFAEFGDDRGLRLGVVDVPGHEGFVRNMLAGATGMDLALLVVASDEGVMPQTREHLAILSLLGVKRLVVALTKIDRVEPAWLELVDDEVTETLAEVGYRAVPVVPVSARTGEGVEALRGLLLRIAAELPGPVPDLLAMPVDRIFTVRGTGTVVTGTLVSGAVHTGDRVRLMPSGLDARVRGLQVHGAEVDRAEAGSRTAMALVGEAIDREAITRGEVVVSDPGWVATHMLTVFFRVWPGTGWELIQNQRVRVHLGTAEVMARCVLFGVETLGGGEVAWGQLRLESPVVARARATGVIRSYSPVTTIGGIRIAEPLAPKRGRTTNPERLDLARVLTGDPADAVAAVVALAGTRGVAAGELPLRTGLVPVAVEDGLARLRASGGAMTAGARWLSPDVTRQATDDVLEALDAVHRAEPWRPGVPVETLRARLPGGAAHGLADLILARAQDHGHLVVHEGTARRPGFQPELDEARTALREDLAVRYEKAGLTPPFVDELPGSMRADPAFQVLLDDLVAEGRLVALDHELYASAGAIDGAVAAVRARLTGRSGLGPSDFRDALPVTRRHLLPILAWMDRCGVTLRDGDRRSVPA